METFQTDDILFCAFALTQGIKLVEVIEDTPHHFIFILSNSESCLQLKNDYINGASAPAKQLFSQRETLISEIKNRNQKGDKYGDEK